MKKIILLVVCAAMFFTACSQESKVVSSENVVVQGAEQTDTNTSSNPIKGNRLPDYLKIGLTVSQFAETLGNPEKGYPYLSNLNIGVEKKETDVTGSFDSYYYEDGNGMKICLYADESDDMIVKIIIHVNTAEVKDNMINYYFYAGNAIRIFEGEGAMDIMEELQMNNETVENKTSATGKYCHYSYEVVNSNGSPVLLTIISSNRL